MALRKKTSPRPDTNQAPDSEEPTSTGEGSGAQDEDPAQGSEGGGKGSQGKGKDSKEPATEDPQDEVSSKKTSEASDSTSSEKESGSGKESKDSRSKGSKKEKGSASGSGRLVRFGRRAKKEEDRKRLARLKRSGNPAKVAAALEEESRAAANRVSRTPRKIKDVGSPRWYAPAMVTLLITGLLWVVVTYLFKGQYPIPYFVAHHQTDWLVNGNLYVGFVIMMAGFLGLLNWK